MAMMLALVLTANTSQIWLLIYYKIEWKWKLVAELCLYLCYPVDYCPPGSSVHGIFQARVLEWVAISFTRGSSPPRDWTWVSCMAGRFFTNWATRKAQKIEYNYTFKKKKKKEYPRTKWSLFQESQTCSILKSHSRDFLGGTVAKTVF